MSVAVWKMQRASGETRTLEGWGIKSARRTLINQGIDSIELGFARADLLGNLPFDPDEILILTRTDETSPGVFETTTKFRGPVKNERRGAYGASEGATVQVLGPWWYLDRLIYQQASIYVIQPFAPTVDALSYESSLQFSPEILLNATAASAWDDCRGMIVAALEYAIAKGAPIAIGTLDTGISSPRELMRDLTCASVILKSSRWLPGQVGWWDYSVNPPLFNLRERANRPLIEIDVSDLAVARVEINPRRDLLIPGITICYVREHGIGGFSLRTIDKDIAGPDPDGVGALVVTIELSGSYVTSDGGTPPVDVIVPAGAAPAGIAGALYATYGQLFYDGSIELVGDDISPEDWIGSTVAILNGVPEWANARMDVQQVSEDLFSGRTTLTVGPPRQLGAIDLFALARRAQTNLPSTIVVTGRTDPVPLPPSNLPPPGSTFPPFRTHPPTPPEPPHSDHDPAIFAPVRIGRSGSNNPGDIILPCGFSGAPTCPTFTVPEPPYSGAPSYATIIAGEASFGASVTFSKQRAFASRPGGGFDCHDSSSSFGHYSEWTFDLTVLAANVIGAALIGTKARSKADGTTETIAARIDLPIGAMTTLIASAEVGSQAYNGLSNSWAKSGACAYGTLRLYTRP